MCIVVLLHAWVVLIRLLTLVGILMLVLIHHLGHATPIRAPIDPAMLRLIMTLSVHPVW